MTIDLVLISLQTLFLSLFGMNGLAQFKKDKQVYLALVLVALLGLAGLSIFFSDYLKSHVQLVIFLLLVVNYILHLEGPGYRKLEKILVYSSIVFMAFTLTFFQLELSLIWFVAPFVFVGLMILLINNRLGFLGSFQEYFLKAGALLTLLFMIEPVALSGQQNLKPVATIPMSSIINQQNLILLGGLIVLMLVGFFWKEKSRL